MENADLNDESWAGERKCTTWAEQETNSLVRFLVLRCRTTDSFVKYYQSMLRVVNTTLKMIFHLSHTYSLAMNLGNSLAKLVMALR